MDARIEELSPLKAAEPAFDPFGHLDPMRSFPSDSPPSHSPAPMTYGDDQAFKPEAARRPTQPGKMGQLADLESASPAFPENVPPASFPPPAVSLAPDPVPAAAVPVWKRPAMIAALAAIALVAVGVGYVSLNKPAPIETVATLSPAAPMPMPDPVVEPPKAPLLTTPPERSSLPPSTSARARKVAADAARPSKRARKPRPKPVPAPEAQSGGDTIIESRAGEPAPKPAGKRAAKAAKAARAVENGKDPLLEALLAEPAAGEPAVDALAAGEKAPPMIGQRPAARTSEFSLPGLKRPVSTSGRAAAPQARAPRPSSEETAAPQDSSDLAALAEPGKSSPTPGIEDEPVKTAEGDQLALVQVHEQFDFCAQLLAQGAFGDHYDTCLCRDAREAPPYRGRRGFYASAKKKEASSGRLETSAKILASKLDGGSAQVTARWKTSSNDKGRTSSQTWKLEDGLWCQAP